MKHKKHIYPASPKIEIEEIAPFLSKYDKTNPFKVPENYFENLQMNILLRVNDREKISYLKSIPSVFMQPKYALSIIFVLLLIVVSVGIIFNWLPKDNSHLSEITMEDIINENSYFLVSIDEYVFYEALFASSEERFDDLLNDGINQQQEFSNDELNDFINKESLLPELLFDL